MGGGILRFIEGRVFPEEEEKYDLGLEEVVGLGEAAEISSSVGLTSVDLGLAGFPRGNDGKMGVVLRGRLFLLGVTSIVPALLPASDIMSISFND